MTPAQSDQLDVLARDLYLITPAARLLLQESIHGTDIETRVRASAALTALDPLNPVTEAQMRAVARAERGAEHYLRVVPRRTARPDPDGPDADKDQGDSSAPRSPRFYIETGVAFLAETDPPDVDIIRELVTAGRTHLDHGEPRTFKTWAAMEKAVAASTGTLAFGLERFSVPAAVPVLYSSQEDGRRDVRARLRRILAGRGITTAPAELFLSVHAGIDLESSEWQEALLQDVQARGIRLVIFDPIRRYALNADKGPSEVRPVTAFLRRLAVETGAAVDVIHHDVKPPSRDDDTRRRGHKASGGDWFAFADCPIHMEPAGRDRTLAVPQDFKFGTDPGSFSFRIEEDGAKTWARVVGEDVAAADVGSLALYERVTEYLRHNPGSTGNAVTRGVRGGKADILAALKTLDERGLVDSVKETRGIRWFVKDTV